MNEWEGAGLPAAGRRGDTPHSGTVGGERTSMTSVQHHRHPWDPLLKWGWINNRL